MYVCVFAVLQKSKYLLGGWTHMKEKANHSEREKELLALGDWEKLFSSTLYISTDEDEPDGWSVDKLKSKKDKTVPTRQVYHKAPVPWRKAVVEEMKRLCYQVYNDDLMTEAQRRQLKEISSHPRRESSRGATAALMQHIKQHNTGFAFNLDVLEEYRQLRQESGVPDGHRMPDEFLLRQQELDSRVALLQAANIDIDSPVRESDKETRRK